MSFELFCDYNLSEGATYHNIEFEVNDQPNIGYNYLLRFEWSNEVEKVNGEYDPNLPNQELVEMLKKFVTQGFDDFYVDISKYDALSEKINHAKNDIHRLLSLRACK